MTLTTTRWDALDPKIRAALDQGNLVIIPAGPLRGIYFRPEHRRFAQYLRQCRDCGQFWRSEVRRPKRCPACQSRRSGFVLEEFGTSADAPPPPLRSPEGGGVRRDSPVVYAQIQHEGRPQI